MAATKAAQRRAAAEQVCWALLIMMELGGLDGVPMDWRPFLTEPLTEWLDLAVDTGQMKP
jgi:hypothetical protein